MTGECPRCWGESITVLARSAVPGVRDLLSCQRCTCSWRTSEPAAETSAAAYPARFALSGAGIANALEVPPAFR
jgi:hypothetical protein